MKPSVEQQHILQWVTSGQGHLVVKAMPGSGKTTLLELIARILPSDIDTRYLAYSRHIALEIGGRLKKQGLHAAEVSTIHALGLKTLEKHLFPGQKAETRERKYRQLVEKHFRSLRAQQFKTTPTDLQKGVEYLTKLLSDVRESLTDPADPQAVKRLGVRMERQEPESADLMEHCLELVPQVLQKGTELARQGTVDFTDMLYLPLTLDLAVPKTDFLLVDEAQDLSPARLQLSLGTLHAGSRSVWVGDEKQAIYGFSGADPDSMDNIIRALQASVLTLSVSYRLPKLHVDLARQISPTLQARPDAPVGDIYHIKEDTMLDYLKGGELVLCRSRAPLEELQHTLLQEGKAAVLIGGADDHSGTREFRKLCKKILEACPGDSLSNQALKTALEGFARGEEARFRKYTLDRLEANLSTLNTQLESFKVVVNEAIKTEGRQKAKVISHIERKLDPQGGRVIRLCTVHAAKGLEADRVYIYKPSTMMSPHALTQEAVQGEECVQFVALTRAKKALYFVVDPRPMDRMLDTMSGRAW